MPDPEKPLFDPEEFRKQLEEEAAKQPPSEYVDWGVALAVMTLRELDSRLPDFRAAVRGRVIASAERMAASDDADLAARAVGMRELAESWVFED